MLTSLEPIVGDPSDSAHLFAVELKEKIKSQFGYLLYPAADDFQPVYWLATYLSPVHKQVLSQDDVREVEKFIKSKFN